MSCHSIVLRPAGSCSQQQTALWYFCLLPSTHETCCPVVVALDHWHQKRGFPWWCNERAPSRVTTALRSMIIQLLVAGRTSHACRDVQRRDSREPDCVCPSLDGKIKFRRRLFLEPRFNLSLSVQLLQQGRLFLSMISTAVPPTNWSGGFYMPQGRKRFFPR